LKRLRRAGRRGGLRVSIPLRFDWNEQVLQQTQKIDEFPYL